MMRFEAKKIFDGKEFGVYALSRNGKSTTEKFLREYERSLPASMRKLMALLERIADEGIIHNENHSKSVRDGVYELRADNLRMLYFYYGKKMIILISGFEKGSVKAQTEEITRAKFLKKQFLMDIR